MPEWAEKAADKIKHSKMSAAEKKKKEGYIWGHVNKEINEGKLPLKDRPNLKHHEVKKEHHKTHDGKHHEKISHHEKMIEHHKEKMHHHKEKMKEMKNKQKY